MPSSFVKPTHLFVFDVESIGLHGEGFAVADGIYSRSGAKHEFCYSCGIHMADGAVNDMRWVEEHVPLKDIEKTHTNPRDVRRAFWDEWMRAKSNDVPAAADCSWPVEANFFSACVKDALASRMWKGPYPFIDIGSLIVAHGGDPLYKFGRIDGEEQEHHPLHDARQSARIAFDHIPE